jgi:hypothetical protein
MSKRGHSLSLRDSACDSRTLNPIHTRMAWIMSVLPLTNIGDRMYRSWSELVGFLVYFGLPSNVHKVVTLAWPTRHVRRTPCRTFLVDSGRSLHYVGTDPAVRQCSGQESDVEMTSIYCSVVRCNDIPMLMCMIRSPLSFLWNVCNICRPICDNVPIIVQITQVYSA